MVELNLNPNDYKALKVAAEKAGLSLHTYIRKLIKEAVH